MHRPACRVRHIARYRSLPANYSAPCRVARSRRRVGAGKQQANYLFVGIAPNGFFRDLCPENNEHRIFSHRIVCIVNVCVWKAPARPDPVKRGLRFYGCPLTPENTPPEPSRPPSAGSRPGPFAQRLSTLEDFLYLSFPIPAPPRPDICLRRMLRSESETGSPPSECSKSSSNIHCARWVSSS